MFRNRSLAGASGCTGCRGGRQSGRSRIRSLVLPGDVRARGLRCAWNRGLRNKWSARDGYASSPLLLGGIIILSSSHVFASPGGPCTWGFVVSVCCGRGVSRGRSLSEHAWSESLLGAATACLEVLCRGSGGSTLTFRVGPLRFQVDFASISRTSFASRCQHAPERPSLARVVKPISLCGFATQNHHFWFELDGRPQQLIAWILAALPYLLGYHTLAWKLIAAFARWFGRGCGWSSIVDCLTFAWAYG